MINILYSSRTTKIRIINDLTQLFELINVNPFPSLPLPCPSLALTQPPGRPGGWVGTRRRPQRVVQATTSGLPLIPRTVRSLRGVLGAAARAGGGGGGEMSGNYLGDMGATGDSDARWGEKRWQYYLTAYWAAPLRYARRAHEKRGTPTAVGRAPSVMWLSGTNVKRIFHICNILITLLHL